MAQPPVFPMRYSLPDNRTPFRFYVLFAALCLFICLGLCSSVAAYVLQGPHILDLMIQQYGRAQRLLVNQQLVISRGTVDQGPRQFRETARYGFPDFFRSDTVSESIRRIHVSSQGKSLTIMQGKIISVSESDYDLYKDLLLYHSRILMQNRLNRLGIDVTTSSVGRFQNRIAYVIGAQYPDESRSQVWIDKNSFRPIRWLITEPGSTENQTTLEFRYDMWNQIDSINYPMHIQIFQNGFLVREIKAESIVVDPTFEAGLFDIDHLKTRYDHDRPEPVEDDELGEVQKTIREFKRRFE